ncbi:MAG: hypothetical protein NT075_34360 [Chloroflexi bacterium]|nr:hypothetical protein [Chloroflexota bacterium]
MVANPNFWLSLVHPDDKVRAAGEAVALFGVPLISHGALLGALNLSSDQINGFDAEAILIKFALEHGII